MAVPDHLTLWRGYVQHRPVEPAPLTPAQCKALRGPARAAHEDARLDWINADVALTTSDLTAISDRIRLLTVQNRVPSATARPGLAISGAATLGKSTIALNVGRNYERKERRRLGDGSDDIAPVVYVVVPPATTGKALMQRFATLLGQTYPPRATTQQVRDLVVATLRSMRTSLVIVDEVHEVRTNRAHGAEAASTMKLFAEQIDATFLYAGIDLPSSDLFFGAYGASLRGRMDVYEMSPFLAHRADHVEEWREFMQASESHYGLHKHSVGDLDVHATDLMRVTGGSLGVLRRILNRAATAAVLDGTERITKASLNRAGADLDGPATVPRHLPELAARTGS